MHTKLMLEQWLYFLKVKGQRLHMSLALASASFVLVLMDQFMVQLVVQHAVL